jgi:hypothetical protein
MAFCVASGRRSFAAKEHKEHKEKKLQSLWVLCVLLRLIFVAASAPRERIVAVLTSRTHILGRFIIVCEFMIAPMMERFTLWAVHGGKHFRARCEVYCRARALVGTT